ncbi:MAG: hypothetical protein WCD54_05805 [Pseudolabrys sp.]
MVDRLINPERTEPIPKVSEQRRRLWSALNDYIRGQGGWVTSPPFGRFVRVEVEQGSPLPVQLEKAGHRLHHAGMTTRIGPGFRTVDVLELDLSGR